jgi:hypothetical protein
MEQPDAVVARDSAVEANKPAASEPAEQHSNDDALIDALQEQQAESDDIEEDIEGVKVRGKKDAIDKLKAERLMQADYTRKTQAAAEERKSFEFERQSVAQQREAHGAFMEEVASVKAMDQQIAKYAQVDWDALDEQDPIQSRKLERQLRTLQEQRSQLAHSVAGKYQAKLEAEGQETATLAAKAAEQLRREIPNWSAARDQELREYVVKQGVRQDRIAELVTKEPSLGKIFHKAELYDRLVAKTTTKAVPEAQEKPVTRVSATRTTANKDPDRMSVEEWTRWREAQIKRR